MPSLAETRDRNPLHRIAKHSMMGFCCMALAGGPAIAAPSSFWSGLDRDGPLSAGWVQVLPVLSSACNFRLDGGKLNATLIDLSRSPGNTDYSRDLYNTLYRIEKGQGQNHFVTAWNARFHGDQTAACATAERLWGTAGTQFAGILVRDPPNDATSTINGSRPNNCQ